MACKMFTCKYLKDKDISFKSKDILILNSFFNRKQQEILDINLFTPKERIIDKLIKDMNNKQPYFIYYIRDKARIKNK